MTEEGKGFEAMREAVTVLRSSGVLARTEEEARVLSLWREVDDENDRAFCLGLLAGLRAAAARSARLKA